MTREPVIKIYRTSHVAFLFTRMKINLKGQGFDTVEDIKLELLVVFIRRTSGDILGSCEYIHEETILKGMVVNKIHIFLELLGNTSYFKMNISLRLG